MLEQVILCQSISQILADEILFGANGKMKRISILLCLIAICLAGCSNSKTFDELDADPVYDESETVFEEETEEPAQTLTLTSMSVQSGYSEGYAWMKLASEEYSSLNGFVNKEGEIVAAFSTESQSYEGHTEFEDGYAIIIFDTEVDVLNTNGDIVSTQQLGEDDQLVAYGAGYTVIENHIHSFDHNSYEYIFYNPEGEEITKYVPEDGETHEVTYMGGGVFSFNTTTEDGNNTNDIYFSKTNKWIQQKIGHARNDIPITFGKSDKRVINCYEDEMGGILTVIDKNGDVMEYRLSIKPEYTDTILAYSLISDNYCLVIDGDSYFKKDSISVLDLNTGTQTKMSDTYFDKVKEKVDWYSEYKMYFADDVFSVPLWGDDGDFYIGLFDVNCNLISEPIRVDSYTDYSFSDGRLVIEQEDDIIEVYSVEGQKLYTVNEVGIYSSDDELQKYSDGIFLDKTSELNNIQVYDLDRNIPYTTLDR